MVTRSPTPEARENISKAIDAFLDHAEVALQNGDPRTALESCVQALDLDPRNEEALYLLGECHQEMGDIHRAADAYQRAVLQEPTFSRAWAALGGMHLLNLRWEEARRCFNRALREDPHNADAWYGRAVLRERRGQFDGADRDLMRASRIDPDTYTFPEPLTDDEIEEIVETTISLLHPTLQDYLSNVAILLDEVPSEEVLRQYDPPAAPGEVLGYFSGTSLLERSLENPWSQLPSAIVLFRRVLQRHARNREQLVSELQVTLFHEVGHLLGLDEEDLVARGLE